MCAARTWIADAPVSLADSGELFIGPPKREACQPPRMQQAICEIDGRELAINLCSLLSDQGPHQHDLMFEFGLLGPRMHPPSRTAFDSRLEQLSFESSAQSGASEFL
jgi:hypothetical protein